LLKFYNHCLFSHLSQAPPHLIAVPCRSHLAVVSDEYSFRPHSAILVIVVN